MQTVTLARHAMATRFELVLHGDDPVALRAAGEEALDEIDPETFDGLKPVEDIGVHHKNWLDSIRANKQPNCGIDLAVRAQTVISLAEMSDRLKVACLFDEKTRKVTTADGKEVKPLTYGATDLS